VAIAPGELQRLKDQRAVALQREAAREACSTHAPEVLGGGPRALLTMPKSSPQHATPAALEAPPSLEQDVMTALHRASALPHTVGVSTSFFPLMEASAKVKVSELLGATGAGEDGERLTPRALSLAAQDNCLDKLLVALATWRPGVLGQKDWLGRTPMHYLAYQALRQRGQGPVLEDVVAKAGREAVPDELLHTPDDFENTVLGLDVLRMAQAGADRAVLKARMAQLHDKAGRYGEAHMAASLLVRRGLSQALSVLLEAKPGMDVNVRWCPYDSLPGHTVCTGKRRSFQFMLPRRVDDSSPSEDAEHEKPLPDSATCLLQLAAQAGDARSMEVLLDRGATPQPQDARILCNFMRGKCGP
jgi:hypothetical protein